MFKNLTLFRIGPDCELDTTRAAAALASMSFAPCEPTQPQSGGWVPPRGIEHAPLIEVIDGQWHLRLRTERRDVPGSVVARRVDELAAEIEDQTGRKPGKKARKDLKEQALQELLPKAFTKTADVKVWLSPADRLLMVDTGSASAADGVISLLIKGLDGLVVHRIQSAETPSACMAAWLMDGVPPADFTIDRECELKSEDEMKSVVRYARHALDIDEVRQHLTAGKRPTRLAMTYGDRVSFELTDQLQLRRIAFLDLVFEGREQPGSKDEAFDADAALATGELLKLIPALIEGLGGEHDFLASAPGSQESPGAATAGDQT